MPVLLAIDGHSVENKNVLQGILAKCEAAKEQFGWLEIAIHWPAELMKVNGDSLPLALGVASRRHG